jgi:hypothetical protein
MSTTPGTRLSRYRRAATEVAHKLTERDLDILALVQSFRLLTSDYIQALGSGSKQGLLRRLQKLYHAGYLDRITPRRTKAGGSAAMVYGITNKGVRTLQAAGRMVRVTSTDWNAQNRSLDGLFVDHTLLISQIRTVLTLATRNGSGVELAGWTEGRELVERVEVTSDGGYAQIPVAPDAFFSLKDAKGTLHLFLEADRGTMTIERFMQKLRAYEAYYAQGKHLEKFGRKYFRVITITASQNREKHLIEETATLDALRKNRRLFLFADASAITLAKPERVLEKIWHVPGNSERESVFGTA